MGTAVEMLEAMELDFPNTVKDRQKQYGVKNAYQTISWVYACCNLIADCISGVPFNLIRYSRWKEPVKLRPTEPAFITFYPPRKGEIYTLSEMIKLQFIHLGLHGESFATLTKKGRNTITGIEVFSPVQVTPKFTADGSAVEYWQVIPVVASGGQKQMRKVYPDEMIQWKYPNPYNPFRGLSPLAAARMAIEQDLNMATWNAGFFQNGIRNPLALMLKQTFNPSQREEFMNRLRRNFTGFMRGQLPLLVEGGVDVKVLSNTIKDLDFVEGKSLTREELCAVYGCPPAQVGIFRYANYANSKEQRNIFYQNTLRPKMFYYRDVFQQTILDPNFPGVYCDFEWQSVDAFRKDPAEVKAEAEATKIRSEAAEKLWAIGYDQKQIATIVDDENFDPTRNQPDPNLENLFDREDAKAEEAAEEAAEAASGMEDEDDTEDTEDTESTTTPPKGIVFAKAKGLLRLYAAPEALRDVAVRYNKKTVAPAQERVEAFMRQYRKYLIDSLKKKGASGSFWQKQWQTNIGVILDQTFKAGFDSIHSDLKVALTPPAPETPALFEYRTLHQSAMIAPDSIMRIIEDELAENKTKEEVAKKLGSLIDNVTTAIVLETHRAFNLGRLHAMKLLRATGYVWCCAGDRHREMHGAKAVMGRTFEKGVEGKYLLYPGAKNDNELCTCTIFPTEVVREEKVAVVKKA